MKLTPFYDQDGITIYHGDCAQVLPFLDPVDLLLTDPPYGIGASSGVGKYGVLKWGGQKIPSGTRKRHPSGCFIK